MIYHVYSGSCAVMQNASTPKEAALRVAREYENLGEFLVVSEEEINEGSTYSQIFFCTKTLITECNSMMRAID